MTNNDDLAPICDLVVAVEHFCGCIMGRFHSSTPISIKEIESLCLRARVSIDAINASRLQKAEDRQPPSASTVQVNPCAPGEHLSVIPGEEEGEQRQNSRP